MRRTGVDEPGLGVQVVECEEDVLQDGLHEILGQLPAVAERGEGHEQRFVHEALEGLGPRRRHGSGCGMRGLRGRWRRPGLFFGLGELKLVEEGADEQPSGVSCPREAVEVLERAELALDWDGVSRADLHGHVTVSSVDT